MGIAFLNDPQSGPAKTSRSAAATRGSKAATSARTKKFALKINHDAVRIVEIGTKGTLGDFEKFKHSMSRDSANARMWPPSPVLIEKAVENGLPRFALRHVAQQIAGADKTKISSLEWVIVPKSTLERREEQLSPLESERTERVARIFVHARRALGSEAEAREFMTRPHPQLDGRTPIDSAKTDLGTRRTEQILNALEYGLAL
jgi:putative toxin-antitoxin system antitoxin component (TIGR02293 family)